MFRRRNDKLAHHFRAFGGEGFVALSWRASEASGARYRLLRSHRGYPAAQEAAGDAEILWEGAETEYQDRQVAGQRRYFYALYARGSDGRWLEQARVRVRAQFPPVDRGAVEALKLATRAYDSHPQR